MKKLLTLIAVMMVCNLAGAITIQYVVIDPIDPNIPAPILGSYAGYPVFDPNEPLVELIYAGPNGVPDPHPLIGPGDDVVLRQSSMGMNAGPNMCVDAHTGAFTGGEPFFVRVYNGPMPGATWYGDSQIYHVAIDSQTQQPLDTFVEAPGLVTDQLLIPEPSILMSGLALLLLRKRS
jgi:hypothetical protein